MASFYITSATQSLDTTQVRREESSAPYWMPAGRHRGHHRETRTIRQEAAPVVDAGLNAERFAAAEQEVGELENTVDRLEAVASRFRDDLRFQATVWSSTKATLERQIAKLGGGDSGQGQS